MKKIKEFGETAEKDFNDIRNTNMENKEDLYISQIEFPIAIEGAANANHTKIYLSDGSVLSGVQSVAVIADAKYGIDALRYRIEGILYNSREG